MQEIWYIFAEQSQYDKLLVSFMYGSALQFSLIESATTFRGHLAFRPYLSTTTRRRFSSNTKPQRWFYNKCANITRVAPVEMDSPVCGTISSDDFGYSDQPPIPIPLALSSLYSLHPAYSVWVPHGSEGALRGIYEMREKLRTTGHILIVGTFTVAHQLALRKSLAVLHSSHFALQIDSRSQFIFVQKMPEVRNSSVPAYLRQSKM